MATKFPWTNRETRLWLIQNGQPEFLQCVGLRAIDIVPDLSESSWTCGHCGSYIENETSCSHCNAPKSGRQRHAEAEIYGWLPNAKILVDLKEPFAFEVHRALCGRPDDYDNGQTILRLWDCKVSRKWIDDPVILYSEEASNVELHLIISCMAMLFFPEVV